MCVCSYVRLLFLTLCLALSAAAASAQQTGSIQGKVIDNSGGVLPGVTIEASADVLPSARVTTTDSTGRYQLPQLPPGDYTLTFTLSGMQTSTRKVRVQLAETTVGRRDARRRRRHRERHRHR